MTAKTLEQWTATMHRVPQMVDGLREIIKDSKITLPDRKYLFMYQSPEMQNFREMGMMEAVAN